MKTRIVGIFTLCFSICACVSNNNSSTISQSQSTSNTDIPTYSQSVKCASMANAIHSHQLMIGGQDLVKLEKLAFDKAKTLAESQQKSFDEVNSDFSAEINKIDMQVEKKYGSAVTKVVVKSDNPNAKVPNFGNNLNYLDVVIEFQYKTPCIEFFGNSSK